MPSVTLIVPDRVECRDEIASVLIGRVAVCVHGDSRASGIRTRSRNRVSSPLFSAHPSATLLRDALHDNWMRGDCLAQLEEIFVTDLQLLRHNRLTSTVGF